MLKSKHRSRITLCSVYYTTLLWISSPRRKNLTLFGVRYKKPKGLGKPFVQAVKAAKIDCGKFFLLFIISGILSLAFWKELGYYNSCTNFLFVLLQIHK